jgi:flavin-dependent dehydrogenase
LNSKNKFDVIVLGGGPAGLGSALNLAEKGISVLLLEKSRISQTEKTWLTFDYILEKYRLKEYIRNKFSEVVFSCYLGNNYSITDKDFIYPVYEDKVLETLAQQAKSAGAFVHDEEAFINYTIKKKDDTIILRTTKSTYFAKLVVDAMGRQSDLLRSIGLKNETIDMGCLVFYLEGVAHKNDNKLLLYDSFFPGSDYFWLAPLEGDRLMTGIFFFSTLMDSNLREKTEKLKFYIKSRNLKGHIYDTRMGNIPLGIQGSISTDSFLCIGDSSNTPLPSSGFSFNRCLEESEILADFVFQVLDNKVPITNYKKEILSHKIPGIEVHLIISDMLCNFTDPMLNKAIGELNNLGIDFILSLLTGKDMGINFSINALRAILNTFSLAEISSLSLKQKHLKNLVNLYNLLPVMTPAKIGDQIKEFIMAIMKKNDTFKKQ